MDGADLGRSRPLGGQSIRVARAKLSARRPRLKDEYDIMGSPSDIVLEKEFAREEWSKVANELARRLKSKSVPVDEGESYSRHYHRDQIRGYQNAPAIFDPSTDAQSTPP